MQVASGLEKVIPEVKAKERELAAATMAAEEAAAAKATSPPRDARARPQRRSAASESLAQATQIHVSELARTLWPHGRCACVGCFAVVIMMRLEG
eukprot:4751320-Pleurochrysis_carterae.AAC.1